VIWPFNLVHAAANLQLSQLI